MTAPTLLATGARWRIYSASGRSLHDVATALATDARPRRRRPAASPAYPTQAEVSR